MLRIGIDSGGTFTDVCLFDDETGKVYITKVSSTPADPSEAIAAGLEQGLELAGKSADLVEFFGHGTTVATNALIELRGAKTALVTNRGFRDLLEIARQKRPHLYDLQADKPTTLVTRDLRFGIGGRLDFEGKEIEPLDEDALRECLKEIKASEAKAVAVCLLYSYTNPVHEKRVREIIEEELPGVFLSISSEIAPEFREYERLSTTVINAYLGPVMQAYIERLGKRLDTIGIDGARNLTMSNGGVTGLAAAARSPVQTLLSGPSTGVVAAQAVGLQTGDANVITFDVGGTSSDVALLTNGECAIAGNATVHGYPVRAPMLDIHTIGAGGGSIAHIDEGGLLKVGPRSAGADPGPVCYGRGNDEPTLTDANVVLQTLNPEKLLGGRLDVRQDLARAAIAKLADKLGLGVEETAQGMISVAIANMAKAIRVISVQRGYDPRDYALMAFGGGGPLYTARLARELGMSRSVVPLYPGVMCAMGLLMTDLKREFVATRFLPLAHGELERELSASVGQLVAQAEEWFAEEGVLQADRKKQVRLDMRYNGQNYELPILVGESSAAGDLAKSFVEAHERAYGFALPDADIEIRAIRLEARGLVPSPTFERHEIVGKDASAAIVGQRKVWLPETQGWTECPVYERSKLVAGNVITGPAIVQQLDTTTVILPSMTGEVDAYLNLVLEEQA